MKHKIFNFTLVELLLVITIIAILAGISIPVISSISNKGRETQARADMNAIKLGLTQFKADYSVWPQVFLENLKSDGSSTNKVGSLSDNDVEKITKSGDLIIETPYNSKDDAGRFTASTVAYDRLIQSLTTYSFNNEDLDKATYDKTNDKDRLFGNRRSKVYLDAPAKAVTTLIDQVKGFYKLDPWGRRYNIALDWNYNGKIDLDDNTTDSNYTAFARSTETKPIVGPILIYCYGSAEDTEDTEAFLYSWKTIEN